MGINNPFSFTQPVETRSSTATRTSPVDIVEHDRKTAALRAKKYAAQKATRQQAQTTSKKSGRGPQRQR